MDKKLYITTPLYYVNAAPHIGHAYTTVAADVLARHYRHRGMDVHLLTGTDEHGANIEKIAAQAGIEPRAWADKTVASFKTMWDRLGIRYDDFIRTTEERHESRVQEVFRALQASGDITLGKYSGWYCLPCENYWEESGLLEGKRCPVHRKPVEHVEEPSYFFKLSKYEKPLLEHFDKNPDFLLPKWRAKEIINWTASGLKDISVSRTKVKWGVPVPDDPAHTIYVWFDALLNYLTATGYRPSGGDGGYRALWPADVHLVGKEIYRFHAVIWPAMLMGLGVELPRSVFAHGWWTVEGEKMSKSRGNFVDPGEIVETFGVEPFRYFLLREVPFGNDGDFSKAALRRRYNSDLANDLGNLVSRVVDMTVKFFDGELPKNPPLAKDFLAAEIAKKTPEVVDAMERLAFHEALDKTWEVLRRLNKRIDETRPWKLVKTDPEAARVLLFDLVSCLKIAADWLTPFMPETSAEILRRLGVRETAPAGGVRLEKCLPLFPRMRDE